MSQFNIKGKEDDYQLGKFIDQSGCFGDVLEGKSKSGAEVAIKITKLSELSARLHKQILRENQILFAIHHPNIVKVLDLFMLEEQSITYQYSVMEKLSPISDLQMTNASQRQFYTQQIAIDLLFAMHYLQTCGQFQRNVVHRDISIKNIMLKFLNNTQNTMQRFVTKIIDFNQARENDSITQTICTGNPQARAPECWSSTPKYTTASDLWGVGIVLFELASGEAPYSTTSVNFQSQVNKVPSSVGKVLMPLIQGLLNQSSSGEANETLVKFRSSTIQSEKEECIKSLQKERFNAMYKFLQDNENLVDDWKERLIVEAPDKKISLQASNQLIEISKNVEKYINTQSNSVRKISGSKGEDYVIFQELNESENQQKFCLSKVYLAYSLKDSKKYAIKIKDLLNYWPKQKDEVIQRSKLLMDVHHNSIVDMHDSFTIMDEQNQVSQLCQVFEVMRCVDEKSMEKVNKEILNSSKTETKHSISLQQQRNLMSLKIAVDLLLALCYLSEYEYTDPFQKVSAKGLTHKEITLQHIMMKLTENGEMVAKLISMDVSREADDYVIPKDLSQLCHLAPECFKARSFALQPQYSLATDLWSLGLVLFQLASGCAPYSDQLQKTEVFTGHTNNFPEGIQTPIRDLVNGLLNMDQAGKLAKNEFLLNNDVLKFNSLQRKMWQCRVEAMNQFLHLDQLKYLVKSRLQLSQDKQQSQFAIQQTQMQNIFKQLLETKFLEIYTNSNNNHSYGVIQVIQNADNKKKKIVRAVEITSKEEFVIKIIPNSNSIFEASYLHDAQQSSEIYQVDSCAVIQQEYFQDGSYTYLVMEPLVPLSQVLVVSQKDTLLLKRITTELLSVVRYMGFKTFHSAVWQEHVMACGCLDGEWTFKLVGFGNAFKNDEKLKVNGKQPNFKFRPPEYWDAQQQFSHQQNIWSVGIILLELTLKTSVGVKNKKDSEELINKVSRDDPFLKVLEILLATNPADRKLDVALELLKDM